MVDEPDGVPSFAIVRRPTWDCETSLSSPPPMEIEGTRFVFYGMADSKIGVARLDPREH